MKRVILGVRRGRFVLGFSVLVGVGGCGGGEEAAAAPAPAPAASAPAAAYSAGQSVQVEWNGTWYAASVIAPQADGTFRIHYTGWSDSWDENVPANRIRVSGTIAPPPTANVAPATGANTNPPGVPNPNAPAVDATTTLNPQQDVWVEWGGSWYDGTVLAANPDGTVQVHYDGWASSWDTAVTRNRLQLRSGAPAAPAAAAAPAGSPPDFGMTQATNGGSSNDPGGAAPTAAAAVPVNTLVQVSWNGRWYHGTVLGPGANGTIRIHYPGWASSWDADVALSNIRVGGAIR